MNNKTAIIVFVVVLIMCYYLMFSEHFADSTPTPNNIISTSSSNSTDKSHKVYVFLSKTCPHCHTYRNETHPTLSKKMKDTPHDLDIISSDNDPNNLFSKYSIRYVPACVIIKDDKHNTLSGHITYENIMNTIKSM